MKQMLKYFYRYFLGLSVWQKNKRYLSQVSGKPTKSVYIELSENKFERYLYLFIKFFLLEGYTVYIKKNYRFLGDFDVYPKLLFKEKNLVFTNFPATNATLKFSDCSKSGYVQLGYDYFNKNKEDSFFYVPMALHPNLYFHKYWNTTVALEAKRLNSLFFAGNFDAQQYHQIEDMGKFKVASRLQLIDQLRESNLAAFPKTAEEFRAAMQQFAVIIVDTKYFGIEAKELRPCLAQFNFFLACPGISMPFSHNIIEAMSCGTIPVIEREYAQLFSPPLKHLYNAIIFENAAALNKTVELAILLESELVSTIRKNVVQYYSNYLSPQKVVESLANKKPNRVMVLAEAHSVRLMKN